MQESIKLIDLIDKSRLPRHIAIIMDGNGRWAQQRGEQRVFGHNHGVQAVRETTEAAAELGISYLTLYAFSTENWNRPREEVDALMHLLVATISNEVKTLNENNVSLKVIGNLNSLNNEVRSQLMQAIHDTANNTRLQLYLALSYSGRWEITEATRKIAVMLKNNEITVDQINEELISECMNAPQLPDPELLIRTSGEYRTSNFLMWQSAYTEFYFTPILWPDFRKDNLYEAIIDYQHRERRFGKTSEQTLNTTE